MTDELTRRQKAGAWATARRARQAREVSRGHVAAALAERAAPAKPLVVETLEAKLERLVPGAVVLDSRREATEDRWYVMRGRGLLATGASAREAVDRAVFLWGER